MHTKGAKRIMALLVAMVVLVVTGLAYVAISHPADPHGAATSNGGDPEGDHQGIDDILVVDGVDGLVGRWLDAEDPGEPPD